MTEQNIYTSSSLWVLILGTLMFLVVFVAANSLTAEVVNVRAGYLNYTVAHESLRGTEFNVYNGTTSFNITTSAFVRKVLSGQSYDFKYTRLVSGGVGPLWTELQIAHISGSFFGVEIVHALEVQGKKVLSQNDLLAAINEDTQLASFTFSCETIIINCTISSADNNTSLRYAILNGAPLNVNTDFDLNFQAMGTSIWTMLANFFTFQTIRTDNTSLDYLLNAIITTPLYVSMGYIFYKLIVGLIPLASGGSGA